VLNKGKAGKIRNHVAEGLKCSLISVRVKD
jgi:hypothetical protein